MNEKIWRDEYIEILSLLPLEKFNLDRVKLDGEGAAEISSHPVVIFQLVAALRNFGEAYWTYGGMAWLCYDVQFHLQNAVRPAIQFEGQWSAGQWPSQWREMGLVRNLALLELFPILVATGLWGDRLRNKRV